MNDLSKYRHTTDGLTGKVAVLPVRDCPEMAEETAVWFHERWHVPLEAYRESIADCIGKKTGVPQWYVVMRENRIVAGCGVIENDFHERKDLAPNVCAVYVEEEYRKQGIAGHMLKYACEDMAAMGFDTLYLLTDHTGFYERYGWQFLCMVRGDGGELSRMYVHQTESRKDIQVRAANDTVLIRDLAESDLPLMYKWLTDDRVLEYYEGRDVRFTPEMLSEKFLEEIPNGFRVIFEYGDMPVGYGQAYLLSGELLDEYSYPDDGRVVFATDQFIGEPEYWSRGIGTAFLKLMTEYLRKEKAADVVLLDPHKNNHRAIRAYEKAGFRIIGSLPEHEMFEGKKEDCWLMELVLKDSV